MAPLDHPYDDASRSVELDTGSAGLSPQITVFDRGSLGV
jgi:hypothetical protein